MANNTSALRHGAGSFAFLATLLVLGSPAHALQRASDDAPQNETTASSTSDEDSLSRDLWRVLHLRNGQVLRARARFTDGRWEYRSSSGDWNPLPAAAVERVVLEKDLQAQARKLERELEPGDHTRRVAFADWLISQGLYDEGFEQIERVLRAERDQPAALALLHDASLPIALPSLEGPTEALPDRVEALMRVATSAGPAVQELVVQRLGTLGDSYPLLPELEKALVDSSLRRRELATLALRRLFPGEQVKQLVMRAVFDMSEGVREGAAYALKDVGEPGLVLPMLKALESNNPTVRVHAAEALGNMGYGAAVAPLMARLALPQSGGGVSSPRSHIFVGKQFAYIQDFDVEVAQFEAVADPQINVLIEGAVLDARAIGVVDYTFARERTAIRGALGKLTGAEPGNSVRAWQRWWDENQHDYVPGGQPPSETQTTGEPR